MVTYIAFSVFRTADLPLYAWASGAALVGVLLGSAASSKLDQVAFGRLLVALMCVCCLLMFMSAAGLAGKQQAA